MDGITTAGGVSKELPGNWFATGLFGSADKALPTRSFGDLGMLARSPNEGEGGACLQKGNPTSKQEKEPTALREIRERVER